MRANATAVPFTTGPGRARRYRCAHTLRQCPSQPDPVYHVGTVARTHYGSAAHNRTRQTTAAPVRAHIRQCPSQPDPLDHGGTANATAVLFTTGPGRPRRHLRTHPLRQCGSQADTAEHSGTVARTHYGNAVHNRTRQTTAVPLRAHTTEMPFTTGHGRPRRYRCAHTLRQGPSQPGPVDHVVTVARTLYGNALSNRTR